MPFDTTGETYITPKKRAPGDYTLWILAINEDGVCTGEYNSFDFTIEEEPEPTEAYTAWIGDWVVGATADDETPVVVKIRAQDVNKSYYIDGLEGLPTEDYGISATGILEEDGTLSIYAQYLSTWESADYGTVTDVLAGLIIDGGAVYYVADDNVLLSTGTLGANGTATLSAGSWYDSESGTLYGLMGMKYYGLCEEGAISYTADAYTALPNTLVRVEPEAMPEDFKKSDIRMPGSKKDVTRSVRNMKLTDHIRLK